jgi:hypothetical protein
VALATGGAAVVREPVDGDQGNEVAVLGEEEGGGTHGDGVLDLIAHWDSGEPGVDDSSSSCLPPPPFRCFGPCRQ